MPQTTPERAARWPGQDGEAMRFLQRQGYRLTRSYQWIKPAPDHVPSERERDAAQYLIEEWDFDGIIPDSMARKAGCD